MSKTFLVCSVVLAASVVLRAYADPNEAEQKFLAVPGSVASYAGRDMETFQTNDLPAGVVKVLRGYDWGKSNGALPSSFVGYAIDLNKDGTNEYFMETIHGGSGGPAFVVLAQEQGSWREVLNFQGGFHLVPSTGTWPKIVSYTRGGGGNFTKLTFEFMETGYQQMIRETYRRGAITRSEMRILENGTSERSSKKP